MGKYAVFIDGSIKHTGNWRSASGFMYDWMRRKREADLDKVEFKIVKLIPIYQRKDGETSC